MNQKIQAANLYYLRFYARAILSKFKTNVEKAIPWVFRVCNRDRYPGLKHRLECFNDYRQKIQTLKLCRDPDLIQDQLLQSCLVLLEVWNFGIDMLENVQVFCFDQIRKVRFLHFVHLHLISHYSRSLHCLLFDHVFPKTHFFLWLSLSLDDLCKFWGILLDRVLLFWESLQNLFELFHWLLLLYDRRGLYFHRTFD